MSEPEPPSPELQLWRTVRAKLERLIQVFGAPAALAVTLWLPRGQHRALCGWLRPLEELLRRLIFAMALKLKIEPVAPRECKTRARGEASQAFGAQFNAADSASWRATFALGGKRQRGARTRRDAPPLNLNDVSSAPCALRLEALIRAFNDPAPLALKLAHALWHAPWRYAHMLCFPKRRPRRDRLALMFEIDLATKLACAALSAPKTAPDSS